MPTSLKPLLFIVQAIEDPRIRARCDHKLIDILVITFCAILCGAEGCVEIAEFGKHRKRWFKHFLELSNGIPSHDTFLRVLSLIDPYRLEEAFLTWAADTFKTRGSHISLDGKSVTGTERNRLRRPLHMVNVFSHTDGLALGQRGANNSGFGECPAVSECLDYFDLTGSLISVDAGITSHGIAEQIRDKGADYLMPIKGNQRHFLKYVKKAFRKAQAELIIGPRVGVSEDRAHDRLERRRCHVISARWLEDECKDRFKDVALLIKVTRRRRDYSDSKQTQNRNKKNMVYYICSKALSAQTVLTKIREHWGIENKLHWVLDVVFEEDSWMIRMKTAARNIALIRKLAYNLVKTDPTKGSMRVKMKRAAWDESYLDRVLELSYGKQL